MSEQIISVHDKTFELFLTENEIVKRVSEIAAELEAAYASKQPVMIGILNGAYPFLSDLSKQMKTELEISFMKATSYKGTKSSGEVNEILGLNTDIRGRHVLIVEDIVDTGNTLSFIREQLFKHDPLSLKIASCFLKPGIFNKDYPLDWVGFEIADDFVIGYGMDYNGLGRNLQSVYKLK